MGKSMEGLWSRRGPDLKDTTMAANGGMDGWMDGWTDEKDGNHQQE